MFGRKAAYQTGYLAALDKLKYELVKESERRLDERDPFTLETLSLHVMGTINRLEDNAAGLT